MLDTYTALTLASSGYCYRSRGKAGTHNAKPAVFVLK